MLEVLSRYQGHEIGRQKLSKIVPEMWYELHLPFLLFRSSDFHTSLVRTIILNLIFPPSFPSFFPHFLSSSYHISFDFILFIWYKLPSLYYNFILALLQYGAWEWP
jgi:hypothetical protein